MRAHYTAPTRLDFARVADNFSSVRRGGRERRSAFAPSAPHSRHTHSIAPSLSIGVEDPRLKVLVIGAGGREHVLCTQLARSPRVSELICAPGNAGIAKVARCVDISVEDVPRLLALAEKEAVGFTVVGPEAPLCAGIVDKFEEKGLRIFGPNAGAAELEGSKAFAKRLMSRYRIPTAAYRAFTTVRDARDYVYAQNTYPIVIKASGLAGGKGVVIARTETEAADAITACLETNAFGEAGREIVVEEFLKGEEASVLVFTDGSTIALMESAQDHKAVFDGDEGANTGGMGAYSPAPVVTENVLREVESEVLVPLVHGLNREGRPFKGVIYAGLMITNGGPKVLEFNVRFGDPEAQAILMRLRSDLLTVLEAVVDKRLEEVELDWDPRPAISVVMASGGYPGKYGTGYQVFGLEAVEEGPDLRVFHAGTAIRDGKVVTAGGRVLSVTALGNDLGTAKERAYAAVRKVHFDRAHFRTDIADRGILRTSKRGPR
jgi:phosphoribosylamine--glycine ligase